MGILTAAMIFSRTANAGPSDLPNLGGYAPVNASDYTINTPNPGGSPIPAVYFLTPEGIRSKFRDTPAVDCRGNNIPGIPPASGRPDMVNVMSSDLPVSVWRHRRHRRRSRVRRGSLTTAAADAPTTRIPVPTTTEISQPGFAMIDKITTVRRTNLGERIDRIPTALMVDIERSLMVFLGMEA